MTLCRSLNVQEVTKYKMTIFGQDLIRLKIKTYTGRENFLSSVWSVNIILIGTFCMFVCLFVIL